MKQQNINDVRKELETARNILRDFLAAMSPVPCEKWLKELRDDAKEFLSPPQ